MKICWLALIALKLLFLLSFELNLGVDAQCATVLECDNFGTFDNTTCACNCFPAYSGDTCQFVNCSLPQSPDCNTALTVSQCNITEVEALCPSMCSSPICTCGFDDCENSGNFDITTCSCQCYPNYSGQRCETLLCDIPDPQPNCAASNQALCSQFAFFEDDCPHLCGICPPTTTPLTTVTPCTTLSCLNAGLFDQTSCSCQCYPGYSGQLCENLDCTASQTTSLSCSSLNCSDPVVNAACFQTCNVCLTCMNSGQITAANTCNCFPSYSGAECEDLDCSIPDPSDCAPLINSCQLAQTIRDYCPIGCGKCPVTTGTSTGIATSTGTATSTGIATSTGTATSTGIATSTGTATSTGIPLTTVTSLTTEWSTALTTEWSTALTTEWSTALTTEWSTALTTEWSTALTTESSTALTTESSTPTICPPCQNGGTLTSSSPCTCSCFPNFSGADCSTNLCIQDMPVCASAFTVSNCSTSPANPVTYLCPFLCGLCGGTTHLTSETSTALGTSSSATPVCYNGGVPSTTSPGTCQCNNGYNGTQCENLICPSQDPTSCATLGLSPSSSLCSNSIIYEQCPFVCGICTSAGQIVLRQVVRELSIELFKICQEEIKCVGGAFFDQATCSCNCPPGFTKNADCSVYDCTLDIPDDSQCQNIGKRDCQYPVDFSCPHKCHC